jgi:peptidoglycan/xylan/chitin deacetylase (PgdA/CDA1 family)
VAGTEQRSLRRHARAGSALVLNLHRVSPRSSPSWPPLTPAVFDDLVEFLDRRCRVVTLDTLQSATSSASGRPPVVLSFDDGYQDFVEYAMPILARHGIRANLNVICGCVETGERPWHVRLYDFLDHAPEPAIRELQRRLSVHPASGGTQAHRAAAISRQMKNVSARERADRLASVEDLLASAEVAEPTAMMSAADVVTAAEEHEIGAHAYRHDSMEFESNALLEDDLARCEAVFERVLGRPPSIYAFPNGSYREEQITLVQQRGIRHVLLMEERPSSPSAQVHPRITVTGQTASEARLRALAHRPPGKR